ncbi:sulfite exporter TauE/SafE family protein [Deinococcus aestuarii]|uniref:sulfite exporter TauE/SafE family protein n=1 Tax=Deinococcus aestuarii TaxID=2774531 RepID=UPI001C0B252C|nr:sulfite exporter TauE/SafE family protein [Deinococcus aestuarii]
MSFDPWQYALGALAAFLIGFSKTGVPGAGILAVPLMAQVLGARLSVGATLPLLLLGDGFAVAFYRQHADWGWLRRIAPWVTGGLLVGAVALKVLGDLHLRADPLGPVIGVLILAMLALTLLRERLGDRLRPTSRVGTVLTGILAGFSTMVSNAAGPVMAVFMTAAGLPKERLLGTTAWTFLIFNVAKVPLLLLLTADNPAEPLFTASTLLFTGTLLPALGLGALAGRHLLPFVPERGFRVLVLGLSGLAAVRLIV